LKHPLPIGKNLYKKSSNVSAFVTSSCEVSKIGADIVNALHCTLTGAKSCTALHNYWSMDKFMHCIAHLLEHGQIHALHCTLTGAWTNSCTALHTYWSMDKFMHCTAHLLEHGQNSCTALHTYWSTVMQKLWKVVANLPFLFISLLPNDLVKRSYTT
jgi:hypothetical protein